jgi:hypothetical protein
VIVREFLPGLIGAWLSTELVQHGPQLYLVDGFRIPFRFADAAYRYGHSRKRAPPSSGRPGFRNHPNQLLLADKRRHATPGLDVPGTTKPGRDREGVTGRAVRQ